MTVHIRLKSLSDPADTDDGTRILVTRFRPRSKPCWDEWLPVLSPGLSLLREARARMTVSPEAAWEFYRPRYLQEMTGRVQRNAIALLAHRLMSGESITLLCYCRDDRYCHRSLLRDLVLAQIREEASEIREGVNPQC